MLLFIISAFTVQAQFVHPGIWHKRSDLDRMKYMVEAQIDPWYTSFLNLKADKKSSYNYTVRKDPNDNTLSRENPSHQRYQYEDDALAAYQNALMWYITGDERHAQKAIEILNAWSSLVNFYGGGTEPLCAGLYGAPMINAAEIIKSTYDGWAEEDIQKFKDMLVYPGYSNTTIPQDDINNDNVTFYWRTFMGDPLRHGNQGLLAWRTVMCIGIFLDNEIIYERALRQILGLPHRDDDIPYPSGPPITSSEPILKTSYFLQYERIKPYQETTIPDYGYDDQIQHYIYDNGQCQESSRDQVHSFLGLGAVNELMEIAWNQGTDIYSYLDDRLLKGLEFTTRYNLSYLKAYPDQPEPWEPDTFYQVRTRNGRWMSLRINPWVAQDTARRSRGEGGIMRPAFEMPVAHYTVRENKAEQAKWIVRARDYAIQLKGYEGSDGTSLPGWGGLSFRRPQGCAGDPIEGFANGVPQFKMNVLPGTVEAENYDFFSGVAEGRTYHDNTLFNVGAKYRTKDAVDIDTCSSGGYALSDIEDGEWLTYTVYVPQSGLYDIAIRYAAVSEGGKMKFVFGEKNQTAELTVPFGAPNSTGEGDWKELTIARNVVLSKGVQSMKIAFGGVSRAFVLDRLVISNGTSAGCNNVQPSEEPSPRMVPGINYAYFQGSWTDVPDFETLSPNEEGLSDSITANVVNQNENMGLLFTGYFEAPMTGSYTFSLDADSAVRLTIGNQVLIENTQGSKGTALQSQICLEEGFHSFKLEYVHGAGDKNLSLKVAGAGETEQQFNAWYAVAPCENIGIELPEDAVSGIQYKYYEGEWSKLPDFDALSPVKTGVVSGIGLTKREQSDNYGFVFSGYFVVDTEGDYTFYTSSDDGSQLFVDGTLVVTNDGTHGIIEASGSTCLGAGYHHVTVKYFDKTGNSDMLMVMYEGGGKSKRLLSGFYTEPLQATGVNQWSLQENDFSVYPNPVSNKLHLRFPLAQESSCWNVELVNAMGVSVFSRLVHSKDELVVDCSSLVPGVYAIVLWNDERRMSKQFIKLAQ